MQKPKLILAIALLISLAGSALAYAWSPNNHGFEIYVTNTHAWKIQLGKIEVGSLKTFNLTVECEEKTGGFLITYYLEIDGPRGLRNDYLKFSWKDTDGHSFTIGNGGQQAFSGMGELKWNSKPSDFKAGHKNNIMLTLTFLTTATIGKYQAKMWVAFKKSKS